MSVSRFISICVIAIFLIVTIGVLFLYTNRNQLIKEVISNVGSDVLKAEVSVGNVELDVFQFSLQIDAFSVQNPEGFPAQKAIAFESILVSLPQSFSFDPIHIHSIAVKEPYIRFIHGEDTTNLNQLVDNAKAYIGSSESDSEYLIKIDELTIEDPQFTVSTHIISGQEFNISMPSIKAEEIGHPDGIPPSELAGVLLSSILDSATGALSSQTDKILEEATQVIESLSNQAQKELENATNIADDLLKQAEKLFQ